MLLPAECVEKLGWTVGDILSIDAADASMTVQRTQSAHDHAMEIARRVMDEYRPVFEALAKS